MSTTERSSTLARPDPAQAETPGDEVGLELIATVIRPRAGGGAVDWSEMVHARELLY